MKPIFIFFRFLKFYFGASTKYRIHSPFVYEFIQKILEDDRQYYCFGLIERLRKALYKRSDEIEVTDFGAGSQVISSKRRKIKKMAHSSLTPPSYCQLLFRLLIHYKPKKMMELGTSFGISTLYQSMTGDQTQMLTLEGCPKVAQIAQEHFKVLGAKNIELINGPFDQVLPKALKQIEQLDYVFIDGNHRSEPTIKYFKHCLKYSHEDSIFIFHDIHWTTDMEKAWNEIQQHPKVTLTIDLFFMGIVFFRKEQKIKEHYQIVPSKWKPWMMGFFRTLL